MTTNRGVFEAATGDEPPLPEGDVEQRSREVRAALDGLLQIRRLSGGTGAGAGVGAGADDVRRRPAEWERRQPVRAVALALEAAGITPSAVDTSGVRVSTGYRVTAGERLGTTVVEWVGPPGGGAAQEEESALRGCVPALERLGWEALLYRGPRRRRFLEVEPLGGGAPSA
ncbi:hypothetical protein [Streptomyces sp. NPDC026092]|uniref:hypothetical protein n=1 Tax=Streptomyces sp. NPDC026092 TaxID=3154797 RepID=UPI0033D69656